MSGKLLEAARKDMAKIVQSGGFEEDITFSDPSSGLNAIIKGLHSKHWLSFDTDGNAFNSKNAHISVMESLLNLNGFATRNPRTGNVDLKKYIISVKDSTGLEKKYKIEESLPSETTGLIVCILGDYEND